MLSLYQRKHGGASQALQYINSNVASSAYAASNPYVPLAKNATEQYVLFGGVAPQSGTLKLTLVYAMSASNGGDVVLLCDVLKVSSGGDPNGSATSGSNRTFTPGTGTTIKTATTTQVTEFNITVTAGDYLWIKITRKNVAGDTHTGSLNVLAVRMEMA